METAIFKNKKPPYICVPITGKEEEEILQQLEKIVPQSPDLIEWRADFFAHLDNVELILRLVNEIKAKTDIPLLFTIRAEHEGGEKISLTEEEKVHIICEVCRKTSVDFVDFETSNKEHSVQAISEVSKEYHKLLILSYHNFSETPDNGELIERAKQAETLGANIAKFAVMPNSKEDVFRLLEVTRKLDQILDIPVITMSMGDTGALSRIIGWAYGSIVTFGVGVESSAPGQIPVGKLRDAIKQTKDLVPSWNSD